jgi:hypothetical protein
MLVLIASLSDQVLVVRQNSPGGDVTPAGRTRTFGLSYLTRTIAATGTGRRLNRFDD